METLEENKQTEQDKYLFNAINSEETFINQLTNEDKDEIKNYIIKNFIKTKNYTEDNLTDDFINSEMYICVRQSNMKYSPHMDELYLSKYRNKINNIIANTNTYEAWRCWNIDYNNNEEDKYLFNAINSEETFINQLTNEDKDEIKNYIIKNFIKTKNYTEDNLTDDFINSEMYICVRQSNMKYSPHMDELYLSKYRNKINNIIANTNTYEVWRCWNIDYNNNEEDKYLKNDLLYTGNLLNSKHFVKNFLSENIKNEFKLTPYYDSIYFVKNNKILEDLYFTYQNKYYDSIYFVKNNKILEDLYFTYQNNDYNNICYNQEWFDNWCELK